jgi:methylmalonyl-CoA carboxyltransferase large subunit
VEVVFRREIEAAADKPARRKELIEEYRTNFASPYQAAARGLVDDIIPPAETRAYLARALTTLVGKREFRPAKKHGLMPL